MGRLRHFNHDTVFTLVVGQLDKMLILGDAIHRETSDGGAIPLVLDLDVVEGAFVTVVDRESGPITG